MTENSQEKVFFEAGKVKVTSSRFVAVDRTFAMANITSVRPLKIEPKRSLTGIPVAMIGLGLTVDPESRLFGILLVLGGIVYFLAQRTKSDKFVVAITTAGGEVHAHDASEEFVSKVTSAINEAIIYRG